MNILILEDDSERIVAFKKKYGTDNTITFTEHSKDAIELLKNNEYDVLFLDHDLGGTQIYFDKEDCGTLVAEYLQENIGDHQPQIIIHSFNTVAAYRMLRILHEYKDVSYVPGIWVADPLI